jgi:hypothetical protein
MRTAGVIAKRLSVVLLACALTACSMARFGYSNGDTLAYWWLDGYVGFNTAQRPWVQKRIEAFFKWHRHNELKEYVRLLQAAQARLQHPLTKEQVLADYEEVTKCGDRVIDQLAPDMVELIMTMDADNMDHLKQKFESNNAKFRSDYLSGNVEDKQEYRYKMVMESAEYWFGDFSEQQEAIIRKASDQRPLNNEMWAIDRTQRQQGMMALVKRIQSEKPSREAATEMLKSFVATNYVLRPGTSPEMRAFFEASKEGVAQLTVVIVNVTTQKQKDHANARLQQWIDDLSELANQPS